MYPADDACRVGGLSDLRRTGGRLRPSQLAKETLSFGAATTKRLARLEAEALITRTSSRRERRYIDVRLTSEGLELIDRLVPEQLERERALLAPLAADEREKLGELLAKVLGITRWDRPVIRRPAARRVPVQIGGGLEFLGCSRVFPATWRTRRDRVIA
ncbi:MarR family winged helix-turn-helix transcriptional regulator [Saccharopolyspora sp. NPDC000995]